MTNRPQDGRNRIGFRRRPAVAALAGGLLAVLLGGCEGALPMQGVMLLKEADTSYGNKDYRGTVEKVDEFMKSFAATTAAGEAYYLRGLAHARLRERSQAEADFRQVLRVSRRKDLPPLAHVGLGNLQFEQWRLREAAREYGQAVEKLPNKPPKDLVLYRLGLCYAREGDWRGARIWFSQVLHLFPGSNVEPAARRYLGTDGFTIQCGAFDVYSNAERQVKMLKDRGLSAERHIDAHGRYHLVQVGHYRSYDDARAALARVRGVVPKAIIVP